MPSRAHDRLGGGRHRPGAFHLLGAFLHAGHAGLRAALACRHTVGPRRPRGAAADRHAGRGQRLVVGDNEPYDGALRGDTMFKHAIVNGFAHALIEIRQDLIADDEGARAWAERLAPIVDAINRRPDIHEVKQFGSRTGPL